MKAVLPGLAQPLLAPHIPADVEVTWYTSREQAAEAVVDADFAWVDMPDGARTAHVLGGARKLKWLNTIFAGVDTFDLAKLKRDGTILTNGVGVNAIAVAEYAVLGVLALAKRYDEVVRAADRHEWQMDAPGKVELYESKALIVGMGTIGGMIADRLRAFGVEVTGVTRSGRDGTLKPDAWQAKLGEFDWVVLAAPSTDDTKALMSAEDLAAMKPSAFLVNIARGDMVDQDALIAALNGRKLAGAFLDTVHPEPLPADHPLWSATNVLHSMHLSGRSQTKMFMRAANLFVENLQAFLAGEPMKNVVDLEAGY